MNELEIIHHGQVEGLSVFLDTVDYRTPHVHSEWELIWILENPLRVSFGQDTFTLQPGEMVLLNPGQPHEFRAITGGSTFLCLQLSPDILPNIPPLFVDGKVLQGHLPAQVMEQVRQDVYQILSSYLSAEPLCAIYCVGKSYLLMHTLLTMLPSHRLTREESANMDKRSARLQRLIRFVDENFTHNLRLADFAAAEGCSTSYMSRFIQQNMNQSFQEYVTSVRFRHACKCMAAGKRKMLEICMESGFSDYRYFSREFKRHYQLTPEAYCKLHAFQPVSMERKARSLHSVERFYSHEESLQLMQRYFSEYASLKR